MRCCKYIILALMVTACGGPKTDSRSQDSIARLNDSLQKAASQKDQAPAEKPPAQLDPANFSTYPLIVLPAEMSQGDSAGVRVNNTMQGKIFATQPPSRSIRLIGLLPDTTTHYAIIWIGNGEAGERRTFVSMVRKDTRELVYQAFLDGYAQPDPDCKAEVVTNSIVINADWDVASMVYSATCGAESEEASVFYHLGKTGVENLSKSVNPKD